MEALSILTHAHANAKATANSDSQEGRARAIMGLASQGRAPMPLHRRIVERITYAGPGITLTNAKDRMCVACLQMMANVAPLGVHASATSSGPAVTVKLPPVETSKH